MLNGELLGQEALSGETQKEVIKIGGGGGGGTNNYPTLNNKPSINDVELVGNKTSEELGLASAEDLTECIKNTSIDRMYGIMQETNENKTLTLTPVNDNEMNNRNGWSWSKYRAVRLSDFDRLLKLGLIDNKETLTEEEKAAAQSWLGVDNKLDKVTEITTYDQLYLKNNDGTQTMVNVTELGGAYIGGGIPRYSGGGCISVGKPTYGSAATPKSYVDAVLDNKLDKVIDETSYRQAYVKDTNGEQFMMNITNQAFGDSLPLRNAAGNICVGTPSQYNHATPKQYVDDKFNGANKAVSFVNYSAMITSINALAKTSYSVGQNIMIITLSVPDLWVSEIAEESVPYTYVSDDDFIAGLNTNGSVQVGFFKLSALETQSVDLTDYAKISQVNDINTNLADNYVKNTDYAKPSVAGIVYTNDNFGLTMGWSSGSEGLIRVVTATEKNIEEKTNQFRPITPTNLDYAVKTSLTTNTETLTDEEKLNAQTWLGIPENYVKNTDIATASTAGISRIFPVNNAKDTGVGLTGNNVLTVVPATESDIDEKTNLRNPIVAGNLDYAVASALKNNSITLTDEEKAAARNWLGIAATPALSATQLADGSYSITF